MGLANQPLQQLIRQRNRYASNYDQYDQIPALIAERLVERLELFSVEPAMLVELGTATGKLCRQLGKHYPKARLIGIDPGWKLLRHAYQQRGWFSRQHFLTAHANSIPLADESVDMVVASLYPFWISPLDEQFAEISRILKPNGLFLFNTLGPDNLGQVVSAWQSADPHYPHLHHYSDMHDVGDTLSRTGFHGIVMENEPLTIQYQSAADIDQDLRLTASANLNPERRKGLTGRQRYQHYQAHIEAGAKPDINITIDLIHGHGWKGQQRAKYPEQSGLDQALSIPVKEH